MSVINGSIEAVNSTQNVSDGLLPTRQPQFIGNSTQPNVAGNSSVDALAGNAIGTGGSIPTKEAVITRKSRPVTLKPNVLGGSLGEGLQIASKTQSTTKLRKVKKGVTDIKHDSKKGDKKEKMKKRREENNFDGPPPPSELDEHVAKREELLIALSKSADEILQKMGHQSKHLIRKCTFRGTPCK